MADGGYRPKNGAKDLPAAKKCTNGMELGEDFPMLCETCLGQNPYVRMVKLPFGSKLCKISNAPYQAFRWKAGPQGRHKETVVSYVVAKQKNICQTCLNDMQYGLPVGVRDKILAKEGDGQQLILPKSDALQAYFYEQQAQLAEESGGMSQHFAQNVASLGGSHQLDKFSRILQVAEARNKTAFRNLPKMCSFWLGGGCTRILKKACPFRPCCGEYGTILRVYYKF